MAGLLAVICLGVSFILHWAGGGKSPFDVLGLFILGVFFLALHLLWPWAPWKH